MKEFLFTPLFHLEMWRWLLVLAISIAAFPMRIFVKRFLHARAMSLAQRTESEFDDRLVGAAIPPLANLLLIAIYYADVQILVPSTRMRVADLVLHLSIGVNVAYFAFRFIDVLELYLMKIASRTDNALDDQFVATLKKAMKILVVILSIIIISDNLGYHVSGILAGLGIGGLAVALAAQDTIANIFGSFTVILDKPFKVKDFVKVSGSEGTIEKIGLRSTRLRTVDGHLVTIPNKVLTGAAIENVAERPTIKHEFYLGLDYRTSTSKIREALRIIQNLLATTPQIEPKFYVHFRDFGSYSLNIHVLYWTSPADFWQGMATRQSINLNIKESLEKAGIELAFPTQTIRLQDPKGTL